MKKSKPLFLLILLTTFASQRVFAQESFKVWLGESNFGHVEVSPAIGPDGTMVPKGTVLKIKATPDPGFVFECGYQADEGKFSYFTEYFTEEFEVTVDRPMSIGASFVEPSLLEGYTCKRDIVYAKPGVKALKYDAYIPDGAAKRLPGIIIIHGGGWRMNCEDVMCGLAREFVRDGRYVVFSIDYRWNGTADGDATPNTLNQLVEDCYGAILHIQEHASEYSLDPRRLAVTGDSAGGHLCTSVANMIERIGDGGFGIKEGVYEYLPTYIPEGMSLKKIRKKMLAIKAAAPNYGAFSVKKQHLEAFPDPAGAAEALSPKCNIPYAKHRKIPHWINKGTEDRLISEESTLEYYNALKAAGQQAYYISVPGAGHAYYDWKPAQSVKDTFWKYGAPYARQMKDFFDSVFY